jgi:hypothetical protein
MAILASLRTLHTLIGDALDDIERVFVSHQPSVHSPTVPEPSGSSQYPSPSRVSEGDKPSRVLLDFPSLDEPYDPLSPAEALLSHPTVAHAIKLIISATGQLEATVQRPLPSISGAVIGVSGRVYLHRLE